MDLSSSLFYSVCKNHVCYVQVHCLAMFRDFSFKVLLQDTLAFLELSALLQLYSERIAACLYVHIYIPSRTIITFMKLINHNIIHTYHFVQSILVKKITKHKLKT